MIVAAPFGEETGLVESVSVNLHQVLGLEVVQE